MTGETLFLQPRPHSVRRPPPSPTHTRDPSVRAMRADVPSQLWLYSLSDPLMHVAGMPLALLTFLVALPLVGALRCCLASDTPPTRTATCVAILLTGFTSAVLWTDLLATALVAALRFVGLSLGVEPSVLGLTVLAWGNSLGDFVADTALAKAREAPPPPRTTRPPSAIASYRPHRRSLEPSPHYLAGGQSEDGRRRLLRLAAL